MIEVLVINGAVYENVSETILEATAFDEDGNPTQYQEVLNPIIPVDENTLKQAIKETVLWLAKQRVQKWLNENGYSSLGDLTIYADIEDGQTLINRYRNFDSAIWDFINSLGEKTYEELQEVAKNLRSFVNQIEL